MKMLYKKAPKEAHTHTKNEYIVMVRAGFYPLIWSSPGPSLTLQTTPTCADWPGA